ncbi:MAG: hypothetical protein KAI73_08320 [Rhodospirillaceae bacterium]|nr:hypothetical protein [Rhodospirillaceae bacterium]
MDEEEDFDANSALAASKDMWRGFGVACETRAFEILSGSPGGLDLDRAKKFAQHAEAAYWQASGDDETFTFDHQPI